MAGENNQIPKGFSELSDLVSKIDCDDKIQQQTNDPESNIPSQSNDISSEVQSSDAGSDKPSLSSSPERSSRTLIDVLVIVGIIFILWFVIDKERSKISVLSSSEQTTQQYNTPQQDSNSPTTFPQQKENNNTELQYIEPPVGMHNVLSVKEIQWCIREDIRIDTMKNYVNTNIEIKAYNQLIDNYNSRCGRYRYRAEDRNQALRKIELYRSQIVEEAIKDAQNLGNSSLSKNSYNSVPNKDQIIEAQQLLTDLGYKPGGVDGSYGRKTSEAIKVFQRDTGTTQNGVIDENLVQALKKAKKKDRTSSVSPKPKKLSFEEQARYKTAQRLARLGYKVNWQEKSLSSMLDAEARIETAQRLARLGHKVDWQKKSLSNMLDAEARIETAQRLANHGYPVDWKKYSLAALLDMEMKSY